MEIEYLPILQYIQNPVQRKLAGIPYITGTINKKRVSLTCTGVGAIDAAIIASLLAYTLQPKAMAFSGIAGALQKNINLGDVVVGTEIFSVDFGQYSSTGESFSMLPKSPIRNTVPPLSYNTDVTLLEILKRSADDPMIPLHFAPIASDQHYPRNPAVDILMMQNQVAAVAMEDIGLAHVGWLLQIPIAVIRGVSDNIPIQTGYSLKNAKLAADHAAHLTHRLISATV